MYYYSTLNPLRLQCETDKTLPCTACICTYNDHGILLLPVSAIKITLRAQLLITAYFQQQNCSLHNLFRTGPTHSGTTLLEISVRNMNVFRKTYMELVYDVITITHSTPIPSSLCPKRRLHACGGLLEKMVCATTTAARQRAPPCERRRSLRTPQSHL